MTDDTDPMRTGLTGSDGQPYDGMDLDELPDWWRRAVEHFEDRDIGPYRPPRFADGVLKHDVVSDLESELDVTISFQCKNAAVGDDWMVTVDGQPVGTIGRHRSRDRYSVFEMAEAEFREWVRGAVGGE